jgi:Ras-related protein Rab-2A
MLVGNKIDLEHRRVVSTEEGEKFAKDHNLMFLETSAKTAHNVEEAFLRTAQQIYQNIENKVYDISNEAYGIKVGVAASGSTPINVNAPPPQTSTGGCC